MTQLVALQEQVKLLQEQIKAFNELGNEEG